MGCGDSLRVHAYFDGEVDALTAADIERHIARCPACTTLLKELSEMRSGLQNHVGSEPASAELRARIMHVLDEETRADRIPVQPTARSSRWRQPFWRGAFAGIGGSALAAALAVMFLAPSLQSPLPTELLSAHIRSLMPTHLMDVVSTDRHTVKPWFAGHTDVSPIVADFTSDGYKLLGGRADYLAGQRSAVLIYQHGAHIINVFTLAARGQKMPDATSRNGYRILSWRSGDMQYCAVSDTGWDELQALAKLLQQQGS